MKTLTTLMASLCLVTACGSKSSVISLSKAEDNASVTKIVDSHIGKDFKFHKIEIETTGNLNHNLGTVTAYFKDGDQQMKKMYDRKLDETKTEKVTVPAAIAKMAGFKKFLGESKDELTVKDVELKEIPNLFEKAVKEIPDEFERFVLRRYVADANECLTPL